MNKISNDKIEKKNLIRKFNKNPILRMKPKKKPKKKKLGQAKHVGLGGPVCLDLKKKILGVIYMTRFFLRRGRYVIHPLFKKERKKRTRQRVSC